MEARSREEEWKWGWLSQYRYYEPVCMSLIEYMQNQSTQIVRSVILWWFVVDERKKKISEGRREKMKHEIRVSFNC